MSETGSSLEILCYLGNNAVSNNAVRGNGVNSVNCNAVAIVGFNGSLSLRTTRCERDSCESCEHENKLFHFFVVNFKCKTINCCIKTVQRYGLLGLSAIFSAKKIVFARK